jgi:DNA-binding CsgD family transcriptional regulator
LAPDPGDRPLAGLVSDEAEALYARLVDAGSLSIGAAPHEIDLDSEAARELVAAHIAFRSHLHDDRVQPVAPATALQLLLARHHDEIMARQRQLLAGWELLDATLSSSLEPAPGTRGRSDSLVEVLTDKQAINRHSVEIYQSSRRELLGLSLGHFGAPINERLLVTPPEPAMSRGGRFRMIYDGQFAADRIGARLIEASVAGGEEARIRATLPLKMLHADDRIAIVALTPTGTDSSLLVRSPQLLEALRSWFELLWDDEATTSVGASTAVAMSTGQRQVLRLLAAGLSDDAIARASGMSVRTVRRHIAAILDLLGVNSRFAAGVLAARRGWI